MIKRLEDERLINIDMLMQSCCGRRILAYLDAYGTSYDFCRFYISGDLGVILLINSTVATLLFPDMTLSPIKVVNLIILITD